MKRTARLGATASLQHERHYFRSAAASSSAWTRGRPRSPGRSGRGGPRSPCRWIKKTLSKVLRGLRDSKEMSAIQREAMSARIKDTALAWGIGPEQRGRNRSHRHRRRHQSRHAKRIGRGRSARRTGSPIACSSIICSGPERRDIPQVSIVHGDKYSLSIAAASVLAKVWRDAQMVKLDARHSQYGFAQHKGYGTPAHLRALEQFGPCDAHRRSFQPLRAALGDVRAMTASGGRRPATKRRQTGNRGGSDR